MQAYLAELKTSDFSKSGYLELFFSGCNFSCPYCNKPHMLISKEDTIKNTRDIKKEITYSYEEAILFSGGEPTLQRQAILELAKFAKDLGKKIIIHTNGSKPQTISSLANRKLLDLVLLDIKAPLEKQVFEKVTKSSTFFKTAESIMEDTKKSIQLLKENLINTVVIITIVPGLIYKKEDVLRIAEIAWELDSKLIIQQFENALCNDIRYMSINPASFEFLSNLRDFVNSKYPELKIEIKTQGDF